MVAKKRASSSTTIPHSALEEATTALQNLPEKPRTDWPLRDAVEKMREPLLVAMAKGYSYEDLATMLSQQGVEISAPSLKYYMTRGRKAKESSSRTKSRSTSRKPQATGATANDNGAATSAPDVLNGASTNGAVATTVDAPEPAVPATKTAKRSPRPTATRSSSKTAAKTNTKPTTKASTTARSTKTKGTTSSTTKRKKADA